MKTLCDVSSHMVTKSLVEVPFSVHGLIFIESVRGPFKVKLGIRKESWGGKN